MITELIQTECGLFVRSMTLQGTSRIPNCCGVKNRVVDESVEVS
jgi:hypothetical protein